MRRGVVAGGNFIRDRVKVIDVYPHEEALANILSESSSNGGGAYNVLLDLAKLDPSLPLEAIGRIGQDPDGETILADCAAYSIDTKQLRMTTGVATSYTDVMSVKETGCRTFFHQRGANAYLKPEDFDFETTKAQHFHLAYLLLLDGLDQPDPDYKTLSARVLANAKASGLTTSVDLVSEDRNRFRDLVLPALAYTDIVFMNEFEASRTSGVNVIDGEILCLHASQSAADRLFELGNSNLIVIHCADSSFVASREGRAYGLGKVNLPPEEIVSSVGAGDAFAAGFLHAYLNDRHDLNAMLTLASCAAATSVRDASCSKGVQSIEMCLAVGAEKGFSSRYSAKTVKEP